MILWQVIALHIQDKLAIYFNLSSIRRTSNKWCLTIDAKYSSVKHLHRREFNLLEKKIVFRILQLHHLQVHFDIIIFPYMIKIQIRGSRLSAHDFRLFSTIHSGSATKCHLRMYSSVEWFNG